MNKQIFLSWSSTFKCGLIVHIRNGTQLKVIDKIEYSVKRPILKKCLWGAIRTVDNHFSVALNTLLDGCKFWNKGTEVFFLEYEKNVLLQGEILF